jgi:hypothetical protein
MNGKSTLISTPSVRSFDKLRTGSEPPSKDSEKLFSNMLVIFLQVHAAVESRYLFSVAIEH